MGEPGLILQVQNPFANIINNMRNKENTQFARELINYHPIPGIITM